MIRNLRRLIVGLVVVFSLVFNAFSQEPVSVQVHYGANDANECSWEIINKLDNSVILSGGPGPIGALPYYSYNQTINFIPGEYLFRAYDSYGDGWPIYDGWYEVTPSVGTGTGLIDSITGYLHESEFVVLSTSTVDLGIMNWNNPVSSAGLTTSESINVIIRNYGTDILNGFSIFYSINGGASFVTETYNSDLLPGDTLEYTFSQTANMSSTGTYNCIAGVSALMDGMLLNDTVYHDVISYASISTYPWEETFSSWPPQGWSFSGTENWLSYANTAAYCNFFYWNSDTAIMISPPLDISAPATLSFDWSCGIDEYSLNDELQVLISTDFGSTWTLVWDKVGIYLNSFDGAVYYSPGIYIEERIDLTDFENNIIYIKFIGSTEAGYNLYVDNVTVSLNPSNDMAIIDWVYPLEAGCSLSSSENITFKVKNTGSVNISNFTLAYSITGSPSYQMESVNSLLLPGDTLEYTFSSTADFSAYDDYNCQALLINSGDVVSTNNLLDNITVKNLNSITTFPFFEDFETGNTDFFKLHDNAYSNAIFNYDNLNHAIKFDGGPTNFSGWIGGSNNTTPINAWNTNYAYKSSAYTCNIDATTLSTVEMFLDLKQFYTTGPKYSWFRILVNGAQIPDDNGVSNFNPTTANSDTFVTHRFDLSMFAGTQFVLTLESSNKYSSYTAPPGNVAFIDNILIQEIPLPDAAVVGLLSPESNCNLSSFEIVTVQVQNNGGFIMSNFDVSYSIDGGAYIVSSINTPIAVGDIFEYSFPQTVDFSAINQYELSVAVSLVGDSDNTNDTMVFIVEHLTPSQVFILGLNSEYCFYDSPVVIAGAPFGGTFSGDGMNGNIFNPLDAGLGSHDITYTHYDVNTGCYNLTVETVIVNGADVSFSGLYTGPANVPVMVEVYYDSPWFWEQSWEIVNEIGVVMLSSPAGVSNGYSYNDFLNLPFGYYTFIAYDVYGDGWHNSYYNITPDFGAGTGLQTYDIPVQQQPVTSQSSSFVVGGTVYVCTGDSPITLIGSPSGGTFSGQGIIGDVFDPITAGVGTFSLVYTYIDGGCIGTDTQTVIINQTTYIDLGPDQFACDGETIELHAGPDYLYEWNTGEVDSIISVNSNGLYSVTVTSQNGCQSISDVNVTFNPLPIVDLGINQNLCEGDTLLLNAGLGNTYIWNNGETTSTIEIIDSGLYTVLVTSFDGCTQTDDIIVTFHQVNVDLGLDTGFCDGSIIMIDAGLYFSYQWSSGSTNQIIEIGISDLYTLIVSNEFGCTAFDSIDVISYSLPIVDLGPDVIVEDTFLLLDAGVGFSSILWSNNLTSQLYPVFSDSFPSGDNIIWVEVVDANGCFGSDTIIITRELYSQVVALADGWSYMSTYIDPVNPLLSVVFQPVVNNVILMKNGIGSVYWPFWGVNGIGDMVIGEGYQISMANIDTVEIFGDQVLPDTTIITIPEGWSFLGYLRTTPADAEIIFSSIVNNISLVKDGGGFVYWTAFGFNGIGDLIPGEGYQILVTSTTNFTYPANGVIIPSTKKELVNISYFPNIRNTGNNMTLAIPINAWNILPQDGDEIGVYTDEGIIVGASVYKKDLTVITIWGDDNYSEHKDGISEGNNYTLKLWNKKDNILSDILIEEFSEGKDFYSTDTYSVLGKAYIVTEGQFELLQNYPNPFSDYTTIEFYMPQSEKISITLYNSLGEKIKIITEGEFSAGLHLLEFSANNLSAGIYYYKFISRNYESVKQFCIE